MNWYKQAQQREKWNWGNFIATFGLTVISGLLGLNQIGMLDLQKAFAENPQQVIQEAEQIQQQIQEAPKVEEDKIMSEEDMKKYFEKEYEIIVKAAKRNNLAPEDYDLLFAIRKAEDGGRGREFGIIHEKCEAEMKKRPNETLDIQAGWAAATIVKNKARWIEAGEPGDFITFLGDSYAPKSTDDRKIENDPTNLNENWIGNVKKWEKKV